MPDILRAVWSTEHCGIMFHSYELSASEIGFAVVYCQKSMYVCGDGSTTS